MRSLPEKLKNKFLAAQNRQKELGQGIVEYILIIGLVGLAIILIIGVMGPAVQNVFRDFLEAAPSAPPDLIGYTRVPPTVTPTRDPNPVLTLVLSDGAGGASGSVVNRSPAGTDLGGGQYEYTLDQAVQLDPVAGPGYQFTGWGDDLSGTTTPENITMDGNHIVSANFVQVVYTLTLNISGNGTVNVNGQPYTGPRTFLPNTSVRLDAIPGPNASFLSWSGFSTGSSSPLFLNMDSPKSGGAFFTTGCYDLTAQASGNGSVTVNTSPNCPFNTTQYDHGTTVSLSATADPGYTLTNWSGGASGTNPNTTVVMNSNTTATANFSLIQYTLNATAGSNGSIALNPNRTTFGQNEVVELTAVPQTGYIFTGWSGDISGTNNPYYLTMDGNKSVAASFAVGCYSLTLGVLPSSTGTVTASPTSSGSCPAGEYTVNTNVTLTAAPNTGYLFSNWSGDISGTNATAIVTMNSNKNITANFQIQCFDVTTLVNPANSGSVSTSPAPNCGAQYAYGSTVTFNATSPASYLFNNWSGDLTGSTNPDTLTLSGPVTVTANFVQNTNVLFVVGNTSLNGGDTAVRNRLQALGYTVTTVDDGASQSSDANGKALVVISSTTNQNSVGTKFRDVAVPVILWAHDLADDMEMVTGNGGGTDNNEQNVNIIAPSHPLAAGLSSGSVRVTSSNQTFSYGNSPVAGADLVATTAGSSTNYTIFGVDQGTTLANGSAAPARRVFLFMEDDAAGSWTASGESLFGAAVSWATN